MYKPMSHARRLRFAFCKLLTCLGVVLACRNAVATAKSLSVSDVQCRQRYPWNGLVDVRFAVQCNDASANVHVRVTAWDRQNGCSLRVKTLWLDEKLPDCFGEHVLHAGQHHLVWDFGFDNSNVVSEDVVIGVEAYVGRAPYMVLDLSEGVRGRAFPVSYLERIPDGGWTDAYKTDKMVLRYIEAGSFTMGKSVPEPGEDYYETDTKHDVVLTRPFYMGVFEVTQRQWELVMGNRPSYYKNEECYRTRPVESVTFNDIRGSRWGAEFPSNNLADATSFVGCLRDKSTVVALDLPTDAEWEYACRAGTNWYGGVHSGGSCPVGGDDPLAGPFDKNTPNVSTNLGTIAVGTYAPNAWGLYDVLGNVAEMCLDWYVSDLGTQGVTDPLGPVTGKYRVVRGGSWGDGLGLTCDPFDRGWSGYRTSSSSWFIGFRVRADVEDSVGDNAAMRRASCLGESISLDSRMGIRIAKAEERFTCEDESSIRVGGRTLEASGGTAIWSASGEAPGLFDVTQTTGTKTMTARFVVVADNVVVHCGELLEDEVWSSNKVHVIASSVIVPMGKCLTIEPGAVVKFMEDTKLRVLTDGQCTASGAIFTNVNDDGVGGDTLQDGDKASPVSGAYEIVGEVDSSGAECRYSTPSIAHFSFNQRYPWNGLVDIDFEVKSPNALTNMYVSISAQDKATGKTLVVRSIDCADEDYATYHQYNISTYGADYWLGVRAGWHRIVWDCGRDNPGLDSKQVSVTIKYGLKITRYSTRKN